MTGASHMLLLGVHNSYPIVLQSFITVFFFGFEAGATLVLVENVGGKLPAVSFGHVGSPKFVVYFRCFAENKFTRRSDGPDGTSSHTFANTHSGLHVLFLLCPANAKSRHSSKLSRHGVMFDISVKFINKLGRRKKKIKTPGGISAHSFFSSHQLH